jgi:hypothetical protein
MGKNFRALIVRVVIEVRLRVFAWALANVVYYDRRMALPPRRDGILVGRFRRIVAAGITLDISVILCRRTTVSSLIFGSA